MGFRVLTLRGDLPWGCSQWISQRNLVSLISFNETDYTLSIIRLNVLSKTYRIGGLHRREIEAVRGVTLSVEAGEVFGLLGPNGAGKTTLVKLLVSIIFPTGGTAYLFGHPIGSETIRQNIGYLPEQLRFPADFSAVETLVFLGCFHGLYGQRAKERAVDLLRLVGLKGWENVKIRKYSKGMLQRLGIAQALLHEPELLILDEPTDGVDPIGRKEIRDLLLEVHRRGTTIFLNSHLLSEVETICDRVAFLDRGQLLKTATVSEITSGSGEFDIHIEGSIPSEVQRALQHVTIRGQESTTDVLRVKTHSPVELNKVIDILRLKGLLIRSIKPVQPSLEEAFINLLKQDTHND